MNTQQDSVAVLRECYEWLFESKSDGPRVSEGALTNGSYTREFHDFHDRLTAALQSQQVASADRGEAVLRLAVDEYPKRNPHQLQAAKVCAGVLALAESFALAQSAGYERGGS